MSTEELDANERRAFLSWRRGLARYLSFSHLCPLFNLSLMQFLDSYLANEIIVFVGFFNSS